MVFRIKEVAWNHVLLSLTRSIFCPFEIESRSGEWSTIYTTVEYWFVSIMLIKSGFIHSFHEHCSLFTQLTHRLLNTFKPCYRRSPGKGKGHRQAAQYLYPGGACKTSVYNDSPPWQWGKITTPWEQGKTILLYDDDQAVVHNDSWWSLKEWNQLLEQWTNMTLVANGHYVLSKSKSQKSHMKSTLGRSK